MKFKLMIFLAVFAAALLGALIGRRGATSDAFEMESANAGKSSAVLVDLFTSEGWSSCPPADELLSKLDRSEGVAGVEVIALSEHVDYWNRLGWTDPFSSADFSARQSAYANRFGKDDVYTPQMVVDGREEFVGSNSSRAYQVIKAAARAPKADITISKKPETGGRIPLTVRIENLPGISDGDAVEVMLAITESNLRSQVLKGENSGRRLAHTAVVRNLSVLGRIDPEKGVFETEAEAAVERGWNRDNLKAVVFAQERASRRVIGAASVALSRKD